MKKYIHPKWYTKVLVWFETNVIYITGSTSPFLSVEILAKVNLADQKKLYQKIDTPKDKFNKKYRTLLQNK
uniref:Ribosomal protein L31 n=1 Tax=Apicomplexa sp. corallicolid ex Leiopathes glaberrima TaxID=2720216 RepID=A0A6M3R5T0_9APIC|nr:ribosomal protein L31 [Apicomplexa sp. corallicolid ex Leiopathes glaberrima]